MAPHILVVEDEEPLLELLRYNFERAGMLSRPSPTATWRKRG